MSVRKCPRCGRQIPSNYRECPYCAQQRSGRRRQPASRFEQLVLYVRKNNTRIFVSGAAFFLCIALLGIILTECSGKKDPQKDGTPKEPVHTQTEWKPLALSQTTAAVNVGESVTLVPSGSFDTLSWTTSDAAIATVNNGRVIGAAAGIVTITASTGVESVSCTVTVAQPITASQFDLALNKTDFTLRANDPPFQMKVRIRGTRDEYEGEVTWTSQDPSVATVSETGLVERVGKGTTTITASADGQTLECTVRVR